MDGYGGGYGGAYPGYDLEPSQQIMVRNVRAENVFVCYLLTAYF